MAVQPASFIPESLNVQLYAGDPATVRIEVSQDGELFALPGEVVAQIRRHRRDPEPVDSFGVDISEAENGVVLLGLSAEQTAALIGEERLFSGEWDCQWFPASGEPLTLVQGRISCVADVTRQEAP